MYIIKDFEKDGIFIKKRILAAVFQLGSVKKNGLYYCTASIQSGSKFLTGAVKEVGYFRVTNGVLTLSPSRFEKQNLEDYTKLQGDSKAMEVALQPYYVNIYQNDPPSQQIINAKAAEITAGITDPYEKAKAIFDWVTFHVAYAYKGSYSGDPVTIIKNQKAVCTGYSNLPLALLREVDIPALFTRGAAGYSTIDI